MIRPWCAMFVCFLILVSLTGQCVDLNKYQLETTENDITFSDTSFDTHAWPMQGYNRKHVGRSPYSTANNPGIERWRFPTGDWCDGSPVVGDDGIIYFGSGTMDDHFYAVYPNGTLKWKFKAAGGMGDFGSSPAIAEDGTIYLIVRHLGRIQAIYPNGTLKFDIKTSWIESSLTIDENDILYYGVQNGVEACYPNGTKKWRFNTPEMVQSTPAIDDNGIIYFGSHDSNIYAIYPNGTLKWKYTTHGWVHGSPTIGTDGTIYCGSDDDHLYALHPNGTLKWKQKIQGSMRASPSQDKQGNLYFGTSSGVIISIGPDGSHRWSYHMGDTDSIWGSTAAISDDGTIYVGANIGYDTPGAGKIIALTLNGTLKWEKVISTLWCESSPVIGPDGSVYICSSFSGSEPHAWGYLHAFGPQETNTPPETPLLQGPHTATVRSLQKFFITSTDSEKNPLSYYVDWGDGTISEWSEDFAPGLTYTARHRWQHKGTYTIRVKAQDTFGLESNWSEPFQITIGGPRVWIHDMVDGFGINIVFENLENKTLTQIPYIINISINHGVVLFPLSHHHGGTIWILQEQAIKEIRRLVFGLSTARITVSIPGETQRSFTCLIIGPYVFNIEF